MKYSLKFIFTICLFTLFFIQSGNPVHASVPYEASDVLGQTDGFGNISFTTNNSDNSGGNQEDSTGLDRVYSTLLDKVDHRLFVIDGQNCRVLIYLLDSSNNLIDRVADYVLGQSSIGSISCGGTPSIDTIYSGNYDGMAYDVLRRRLFVSDYSSHRVLVFNLSNGITNGMDASYVLGQANFDATDYDISQSTMNQPAGLAFDSDSDFLYVSEYGNNRITVFNVAPNVIANGMNASYVLGQLLFNTSIAGCSSWQFNYQWGLAFDDENKRLFVGDGDSENSRIMVFDVSNGVTNGMSASYVLGQPDFDTCNYTSSADHRGFFYTYNGIAYDSSDQMLFVDNASGLHRMLVFDINTIVNGEDAIAVIGQENFVSNDVFATTISSVDGDYQSTMAFDDINRTLYYPDTYHNRVLIFDFVKLPSSLAAPTLNSSYTSSVAVTQSQGTVSYALTSGALPTGLSLNSSTGAITGTPTTAGSYTFTIKATDDNGAIGYFFDTQSYTLIISGASSSSSSPKPEGEYSTTDVPVCHTPKPDSSPTLFQVNRSYTDATLYFTPTTNNTSYYLISYGETNIAEGYSVQLDQPLDTSGAISYSIHSLLPNRSYYFKVRNGNNCQPGEWSTILEDNNAKIFPTTTSHQPPPTQVDTSNSTTLDQSLEKASVTQTKTTFDNQSQRESEQSEPDTTKYNDMSITPWYQSIWGWITSLFGK